MKHEVRVTPAYIRHVVDGDVIATVPPEEWDGYVRSAWSLDPDVVALIPNRVANFPGDKSSGTPARLFSKEEINVFTPIPKEAAPEKLEGPIQEAEVIPAAPAKPS